LATTAYLDVRELKKSFAGLVATNNVSISIQRGEFVAIIGPNGAGKTTLFNLITQFIKPDHGTVIFNGENLVGMKPEETYRRGIGRTFQLTQIFRTLTVYQNLSAGVFAAYRKTFNLFAAASGLLRDKVLDLANEVGLSGQIRKEAGSLSYGDQKRLEVAIALSNRPQLLFLDEPTGGLAPDECAQIMELVQRLSQERNMTTVFIEHDMATVFGFAHRIFVLNFGTIIADGKPEEIRKNEEVQRLYLGETCK
jgi:branched-chain amino acid transport system ATP-binding protein